MNKLTDAQHDIFEKFVGIPSYYVPGECNENALSREIEKAARVTGCRIHRIMMKNCPDGRSNLVVEKGSGKNRILLYAHKDTIQPTWKNPQFFLDRDGDFYNGVGCYDMKQALLVFIDWLREYQVPDNMTVTALFSPDEELASRGVRDPNLRKFLAKRKFALGLSPEISSLHESIIERDSPKDIVIGRRGIVKLRLDGYTPPGHAYQKIQNAYTVHRQVMDRLERPMVPVHDYLGEEDLLVSECDIPKSSGCSHPTEAHLELKHQTVLPNTIENTVTTMKDRVRELMEERRRALPAEQWGEGFHVAIERDETVASYEPYISHLNGVAANAVFRALTDVYGGYTLRGGRSVADSNELVHWFRSIGQDFPWIEIAALGNGQHNPEEKVSRSSLVQLLRFYPHLIGTCLPEAFAQVAKSA